MTGWWIAAKVGNVIAYWYPLAWAWGYEAGVTERYYGLMIGKGHPPS
jgi:hypothetical protein